MLSFPVKLKLEFYTWEEINWNVVRRENRIALPPLRLEIIHHNRKVCRKMASNDSITGLSSVDSFSNSGLTGAWRYGL
jgi:hypothetical protein